MTEAEAAAAVAHAANMQAYAAIAVAVLTGLLVVITGYYAIQNRGMVLEMRAARVAQLQPKLVPTIEFAGPNVGWLRVINVGPGAALDVHVELRLEPGTKWLRRWHSPVVVSGESHDFVPVPPGAKDGLMDLTDLTNRYERLVLVGTCRDVLGSVVQISEVAEVREWWRVIQQAHHLARTDPLEKGVRLLENLTRHIRDIRDEVRRPAMRHQFKQESPHEPLARFMQRVRDVITKNRRHAGR